jgi:hypothetical protein
LQQNTVKPEAEKKTKIAALNQDTAASGTDAVREGEVIRDDVNLSSKLVVGDHGALELGQDKEGAPALSLQ